MTIDSDKSIHVLIFYVAYSNLFIIRPEGNVCKLYIALCICCIHIIKYNYAMVNIVFRIRIRNTRIIKI